MGTPVAWVARNIARDDPDLAATMVRAAIDDYRRREITECIHGDFHNVRQYVASATNVYGVVHAKQATQETAEPYQLQHPVTL